MSDGDKQSIDYSAAVARGMKPAGVRSSNQRAILTLLARKPGVSNAELARGSGLTAQTVSAVLDDLDARGLLVRGDVRRGRRGQPATPLYINPTGAFSIGIEIGWRHFEVILIALGTKVRSQYRESYDFPDATVIFDKLGLQVSRMLSGFSSAERSRIVGVGLAAPAGFGKPDNLLRPPAYQAARWASIDMAQRVSDVTGLDVQLVNDGNAACWAEYAAFSPPRPESFAFLLIDTFVGAGIIADSRLWEGPTGASANLGSMLVTDRKGVSRYVHEVASVWALRKRLDIAGFAFATATADDPPQQMRAVVDDWIDDAAFAIAQTFLNTITVIEYELAILESVLPEAIRARLLEATARHLKEIPSLGRAKPALVPGHLGRSGAALGAAQLRLYRRFFSRELQHMQAER